MLEEGVVILAGVADGGVLRVQRTGAEAVDGVPVDELLEIVIVENFDLLDLMAGAEAVEEVLHGDTAGDGAQMRHGGEVHRLLHAGGGELRPAGLAAGHDVLMIAEDGDAVRADGTGGNVHDGRQEQAGDAVHRRDHEHEALRGGVRRGERAGLERALHGGAGGELRLHFHELDGAAEDVLLAVRGPLVGVVGHRARRGDGIDGGYFREGIGGIGRSLVAVHGFEYFVLGHGKEPPVIKIPMFSVCFRGTVLFELYHFFGDIV